MANQQFLDSAHEAVTLGLSGFARAHRDLVHLHASPQFVVRAQPKAQGRVALLSGGGSGHEPLHAGFVGPGMLDAAVPGGVFASPSTEQVAAATLTVERGAGVLHIVKNYTGDVINFGLAAQQARDLGIEVESVVVDDDVPSAQRGSSPGRRGTVATLVVEKVCGAAAEEGVPLAELARLGGRVVDVSRSVGVAARSGSGFGHADDDFTLDGGSVEFGVGIHGERGTGQVAHEGLDALVERMVAHLEADFPDGFGSGPLLVVLNGLGATTSLELYAAYELAAARIEARGAEIARCLVGDLVTSLDMRGMSLTVTRLEDDLLRLWDAAATTPSWPAASAAGADRSDPLPVRRPEAAADPAPLPDAVLPSVTGWLADFASRGRQEADELGRLDRAAGDGDFGDNLTTAVERYADGAAGPNPLMRLSDAYASVGGSSGPLFALWFRALGRALADTPDGRGLAQGLAAGADLVQGLGGARPGDVTMVDAMVPAAEAAAAAGADLADVLAAAADAAEDGARKTAQATASRGRASYVGERSRGVQDPGATAVALCLRVGADSTSGD